MSDANRFSELIKSGFTRTGGCRGLVVVVLLVIGGCPVGPSVTPPPENPPDKPTIAAPADRVVECDGNGNLAELDAWLAGATFTDGCGGATLTSDFAELPRECGETGSVTVTWTVADNCGASATASATFTIVDTTNPILIVPQPIRVTCGDPAGANALIQWRNGVTATDTCGGVTINRSRAPTAENCTATLTWTATDECGREISASSTYTSTGDTTAPTMVLVGQPDITIECGVAWNDPGVALSDDCDALIEPTVTGVVDTHTPGVYAITYSAVDACGNRGPTITRSITVVDTTAPIVQLEPPKQLWPPNHQLQTLTLADLATVTDACEGELNPNEVGAILDIYSDEPDNDNGDGNTSGDIVIADDHTFSVRTERQGSGNGRVYGIRFEVSDSSGNTTQAVAFVHVPHDQSGGSAIDDGPSAGQVIKR